MFISRTKGLTMLPYIVNVKLWNATLLQYFGLFCRKFFATEVENLLNAVWHKTAP